MFSMSLSFLRSTHITVAGPKKIRIKADVCESNWIDPRIHVTKGSGDLMCHVSTTSS